MAEENNQNVDENVDENVDAQNTENQQTETEDTSSSYKTSEKKDADMLAKLVEERVAKELQQIKSNLDKSYKQRDDALARLAELEKKEREAELKKLEEEGKHKEAFEMRLAEERARNEALEKQNRELSRDVAVRDALKSYTFRNDKAAEMAFKEITSHLIRNDQGQWVHRTGISIRDYCEAFSQDEDQSFLFKTKQSSGGGSQPNSASGGSSSKPKSIFEMSQAEVLKLAAEGKLKK